MTAESRSRVMARVKNKNTAPEILLRKTLYAAGVRGWRCHKRDLPGTPDIVFTRWKLAIFVDGAFWHGHPSHYRPGQSGTFWDRKIEKNRRRDDEVNRLLSRLGYTVIRVWDFEIEKDPAAVARRISERLRELKGTVSE
ncbi:XorII-short-patch-repair endonuclease [Sulfobacillus acidophilus TPY]|nr:XorII-short-patch-repair endonuclease [Sulfobacillus acidophilus TPY]